jgi:hypothetical protein
VGKTPKSLALTIAVPREWLEHPVVNAWREKGHEIIEAQVADCHLTPWSWKMEAPILDKKALAELPLKAARATRKEAKKRGAA